MKIQFTASVILFALIVLCKVTPAQITITSTDATALNAVGNVLTNHYDTAATSIDIGSRGATSWNFSALDYYTAKTFTNVLPSSRSYYSSYFCITQKELYVCGNEQSPDLNRTPQKFNKKMTLWQRQIKSKIRLSGKIKINTC